MIASRGRTFVGTYYSTFTGYINRVRAYHAMQDKSEGYQKGEIQSYYFIPVNRQDAMRKYAPIGGAIFAREFPIAWRDIDHDIA